MSKVTKIKIVVQVLCIAIMAVAIFNLPALTPRPPAQWSILIAVAFFSFGLFWGLGVSHFFPITEDHY